MTLGVGGAKGDDNLEKNTEPVEGSNITEFTNLSVARVELAQVY